MGLFEDLAIQYGIPIWLIFIAVAWSLVWKGLALWKSSKRHHVIWFIAFLVIHTLGILEILYILLFSKIRLDEKPKRRIRKVKKIRKRR